MAAGVFTLGRAATSRGDGRRVGQPIRLAASMAVFKSRSA